MKGSNEERLSLRTSFVMRSFCATCSAAGAIAEEERGLRSGKEGQPSPSSTNAFESRVRRSAG